jgi:hemerythrin-like domain-containing protein
MASKATSRKSRRTATRRRSQDAIALLKEDHAHVKALFGRFQKARGDEQKSKLAESICNELKVHAQLEEEVFYPAARRALEEGELLDEAQVEHDTAKQLIAQIESGDPSDPLFQAKVKVLCEYINHHVEEEEGEMFPQLRRTDLDLAALGARMKQRKQQLQSRQPVSFGRAAAGDAASATA